MDSIQSAVLALAEAQQRTEQRLERLEGVVTALAEAQQRTEQRLEALAEAQQRTEQRLERLEEVVTALAEAQQRTEQRLEQLAAHQARMQITLDKHTGYFLEGHYRTRPYAYLGRVLRRARTVAFEDLEDALEHQLADDEVGELMRVDVIVRGRPKTRPEVPEVWVAIEVSATVDRYDVERAQRRAALLRRAGYRAVPAVAGEAATRGGEESARTGPVVLLQDGAIRFWDEALAAALAE